MQHDDQPPPAYRRPSLLSTEQQEEAARASADARQASQAAYKSTPDAGKAGRGKKGWLAGGAVLVALCAGAGVWMALDADKMPAVVAAGPAEPVLAGAVMPASAPAAVSATAPTAVSNPAEPEVSAATILEQGAPAPAAPPKDPSLKDMLNAPSAPKPKSPEEELTKLLASSPAEPKKAAPKAIPKTPGPVAKPAVAAKAGEKKPEPPAKGATKAPAKPTDDASLLAALVAHSKEQKGEQRTAANAAAAPTSLKQCKQLNAAQAEQCLVRLCAGSAKDDPQCKSRRAPRPAED
ncbi:hypothetical protein CR152_20105 [Massilia violaceinigra]|uniref:Uncharacterized protein n=1 Tax=Massilia violaceinigra TaxID=2045208 RepID=A0A2D2DNM8_9BURK|nr:hypothetical protein [Massilia violaceinigra]ATQ76559.1 hypothetical protein CR152_20105 [Massilia violaceinigra]